MITCRPATVRGQHVGDLPFAYYDHVQRDAIHNLGDGHLLALRLGAVLKLLSPSARMFQCAM